MIVVSDTSPITNLMTIGKLELLKEVFNELIIPEGVYQELIRLPGQKKIIDQSNWISKESVKDVQLVKNLRKTLDQGEAESVVLAKELGSDYLLIDEKKGRKIAKSYGVTVTGLLGILKRAKSKGIITKVRPVLDELMNKAGFWIHPKLYQEILKDVGE